MSIQYIGEYHNPTTDDANSPSGPTVSLTPPSNMQAGDFVLVSLVYRGQVTWTNSTTGGQTWSSSNNTQSGTTNTARLFWCVFNGTWTADPVFTVTTGTAGAQGWMVVWRGVNTITPWDVTPVISAQTASTTFVISTFNTVQPDSVALVGASSQDNNTWTVDNSFTHPSGSGNIYWRSASGTDNSLVIAAREFAAGGSAVGQTTMTQATLGADLGTKWYGALRSDQDAQGQAQATIKSIDYEYGQAQADIKRTEQGYGQAQSEIGAGITTYDVIGQAQSTIKVISNIYAQAQASITPITLKSLVTFSDETDSSGSYTTASISPTSNALVLAAVYGSCTGANPVPSLSGNNLSWQLIDSANYDITGTYGALHLFRAMGSSPTSGQVTINFGQAMLGAGWTIVEFINVDTSGTDGSGAIAQYKSNIGLSNTASVTLDSSPTAGNIVYGGIVHQTNEDMTPGNGYTLIAHSKSATPTYGVGSEWAHSNLSTTVDGSWTLATEKWGVFGVEVKVSTGITSYKVQGQAQASILQTEVKYGQSAADIQQTYYGYGQSLAHILRTEFGAGQSISIIRITNYGYAQAFASITGSYAVYGQSQSQILATYLQYANSLSSIQILYQRFGQALAHIGPYQTGQALAQIQIVSQVFGQALAQIPSGFNAGFANAGALISVDESIYQYIDEASYNDNDYIFTTVHDPNEVSYEAGLEEVGEPEYRQDHFINYRAYKQGTRDVTLSLDLIQNGAIIASDGVFLTETPTTYQIALTPAQAAAIPEYTDLSIRITANAINSGTPSRAYVTWLELQAPYGATKIRRKFGQAQAEIIFGEHHFVMAQAQADIRQTYQAYGQSLADILATYQSYAQAQGLIRATYQQYAETQGLVRATYQQYAQAQADIRATYQVYAQAQGIILATYNGYAQAQGTIRQAYFGYAQAQADIRQAYQVFGQAQSDIRATYQVYGEAQALILQTYQQYGQAQSDIQASYQVYANAQAKINAYNVQVFGHAMAWVSGSAVVYAQAQAKIRSFNYPQFGQAQANIRQTYRVHANAMAAITGKVFAQAQAYIRSINSVYGQAQAAVRGNAFGQAQAAIRGNVFAQAQADILATYKAYGQAQAIIRQSYQSYAQGMADIRAIYQVFGQAQAVILSAYRVYGQGQSDIQQTYRAYGQAQSLIRTTTVVYGQAQASIRGYAFGMAQADILAAYKVTGQANADILATSNVYGQAQAVILSAYQGYAQAQALVRITSQQSGNAQGWIIVTVNITGQAQAYIMTTGLNVTGQSQAIIITAYQAYAQAASQIITLAFGQARARIRVIHLLKNLYISDRHSLDLGLSDRAQTVETTERTVTAEISDRNSLNITVSDRAGTLELSDIKFLITGEREDEYL